MTPITVEQARSITEYPISGYTHTLPLVASLGLDGQDLFSALRPKALRPDQIDWSRFRNQRKIRKNKRRLFAAGGRVNFNK